MNNKVKAEKRRYATTVIVGYNEDGKAIKKFIEGKNNIDLQNKIRNLQLTMSMGIDLTKMKITFFEYSARWLALKEISVSIKTHDMYKRNINLYLSRLFDYALTDITKNDCQLIINKHIHHPRTCQTIKLTLYQIFDAAIEDRIITYNPARKLALPSYKAKEKRRLTDDENILTDNSNFTDRQKAFVWSLKYFGIRKEEALALTSADFDFKNDTLKINKALIFINNKPFLKDTKNHKNRVIPILPKVKSFFKYYTSNNEFLFTNVNKSYITEQGFKSLWRTIMTAMNRMADELEITRICGLTPHIFRHNFACILSDANVKMEERQYLLGHSSIDVTIDIYTHIDENNLDARKKLEKLLCD